MNRLRTQVFFKNVVAFFVMVYIFCISMSLSLLPHYVADFTKAASKRYSINKSFVHTDHSNENFIRITDRSVLDDDQPNLANIAVISLIIFGGVLFTSKKTSFIPQKVNQYYNKQYSYLSLRTIRI